MSARIVVLDMHGEYTKALSDRASVFRVAAEAAQQQQALNIPFWALSYDELVNLAFGKLSDAQSAAIAEMVVQLKKEALTKHLARASLKPM